jgi:FkbH-like protein
MKDIKQFIKDGQHNEALSAILQQARMTSDYSTYLSLCRLRRKISPDIKVSAKAGELKIAILGGSTTDFLELPLQLELETLGLGCHLFSSGYNSFVPEMLDASSDTVSFGPDLAVLLVNPFNIAEWPRSGDSLETVQSVADSVSDHWLGLCESLHVNTNCEIIISNLHTLPTRTAGNLDCRLDWETNSFIRRINELLNHKAPAFVHILDIASLASLYGVLNWFDSRFWHHSRQAVSFDCLVPFVRNLSAIIGALYGRTAKCLALDLDNTLWGGVVGDDGVEGLKIGQGDAEGESFRGFQEYLLRLKARGMLLAVCSKNEEENALAPFEQLPEMLLKRSDFVSFQANWNPKPDNLRVIANELNIGLDAIVFVDDNPAERELVKQTLPQVKIVELSDDPAEYPLLLDQSGWLEVARLTDEDWKKTDQYHENVQRKEVQARHTDYDSYLESLDQQAQVCAFNTQNLERITQLVNKTNQFNLTTKRLNRSEIEALMGRHDVFTASVRLVDQFGDNGLISVMIGHIEEQALHIDLWLMSCRVFKRGVEQLLANHLFDHAGKMGLDQVHGLYIPTEKNKLVESLYADMGFKLIDTDEKGATSWSIEVQDYQPVPVHISLMEDCNNE